MVYIQLEFLINWEFVNL